MADGSFVRVYHEDLRQNHRTVWDDVRVLGTFVQLLARADKLWPTPADLPRRVSRTALDVLLKEKLVSLLPDRCYRVRGLDAMRAARSKAAKEAADARWNADSNADRNADSNADALPRARGRSGLLNVGVSSEYRGEGAGEGDAEPEFPLLQWLAQHGCYITPGNGYHRHLITAVERHGAPAILRQFERLSRAGVEDGDVKGFVFTAIDALKPKPDLKAVDQEDALAAERERSARRLAQTAAYIEQRKKLTPADPEAYERGLASLRDALR